MRFYLRKALGIAAVLSFFMLTACFEPSTEETKEGSFTINLSANENTRAVFPPVNSSDLRFSLRFWSTESKTETTFTSNGGGSIKGKIGVGNYIVTMDVSLISDGSPYARGVAYDNPIEIGSGQNPIKVYVFDVNNAAPPVISAKPQGASSITGATAVALTVTASVNDSGRLSYQWYNNTTNSASGGSAISGATSPSYTPPTATLGTPWHYVVVTNTSTGKPTTISTVPVSITDNPGTGGGTGSADNPFLVNDVTTMRKVGSGTDGWNLDAHYRQTADIDLSSVPNWTPIGSNIMPFTGNYDGNGKTISNLTINASNESFQGLFGLNYSDAVVKNLGLLNCTIIANNCVGGVVGSNMGGTVQNCYATGNVSGYGAVGGVVGVSSDSGTVQNCYATSSVSGNSAVGGVVGQNSRGTLQYCYATGNVSGSHQVGGVVGDNSGSVQNCVALNPDVSGSGTSIGRVLGSLSTSNGTPTLTNCYGRSDMQMNGKSTSWANIGLNNRDGADVSASQYNSQTWWTTAGFDFTNVWEWGSNNLPKLKGLVFNPGTVPQPGQPGSGGSGTAIDPFLVYDVASLKKVGSGTDGWTLDAHYKQTADIDLASVSNWKPIGTSSARFTGSYDGNGKTINNLTINAPTEDYQGLFGYIHSGAVVKNVGLVNCTIVGNDYEGGVVGYNYGTVQDCFITGIVSVTSRGGGVVGYNIGTVQNCYSKASVTECDGGVVGRNGGTVQNCYATGNVSGAGVVGYNSGTVQNCYATGNVSGWGGVVGLNHGGTVKNCYSTGNVSGDKPVGGVVAGTYGGTVQDCYATGNVSGNETVGGVIGVMGFLSYTDGTESHGTVKNCYATGSVSSTGNLSSTSTYRATGGVVGDNNGSTVQNCYATGNVSGKHTGGVVGVNGGTVQDCYATGNVYSTDSPGYAGGVVGYNSGGTVQYCYATGNVSGGNIAGGVVGRHQNYYATGVTTISKIAIMQNCVALNPDVSVTDGTGVNMRVMGYLSTSTYNGSPTLTNNYGRSDMKKNGGSTTWTNDLDDKDGASITSANWGNQSWWTTAGNWVTAGWNFSTVWEWRSNGLPILRNMPGTATQNPVVRP